MGWDAVASVGTATAAVLAVIAIIISAPAAKASARTAEIAENQLAVQTMPVVVNLPMGGRLQQPRIFRYDDGSEESLERIGGKISSLTIPICRSSCTPPRTPVSAIGHCPQVDLRACGQRSRDTLPAQEERQLHVRTTPNVVGHAEISFGGSSASSVAATRLLRACVGPQPVRPATA